MKLGRLARFRPEEITRLEAEVADARRRLRLWEAAEQENRAEELELQALLRVARKAMSAVEQYERERSARSSSEG